MDWAGIAAVLAVFVSALSAILSFRQQSYNKEQEYRLKRREEEDKEQRRRDKIASQNIYRELWALLNEWDNVLRVYIVQPHPLDRAKYISVQYEVLSEGMISIMPLVHRTPIGNMAGFVVELKENEFLYWKSQSSVRDGRARSVMHQIGTDKMCAVRMMDGEVWKGNIVVDFDESHINEDEVRERLKEARTLVQYMLPEIEEL